MSAHNVPEAGATDQRQVAELVRECKDSLRADGRHGWAFDGDDPYVYCHFCGEVRDAITGRVIG